MLRHLPMKLSRALCRFRRREDGSMVLFCVILFVSMLVVAGMSIDFMRYENARTRLQSTLDRAILAAADLDQRRAPRAVVEDYFAKAGLLEQLTNVTVTEHIGSRTVRAEAELPVDMLFIRLLGVPQLVVPAVGTASENVSNIEISLVLDVSGSMADNNRLRNLKTAATNFVDTIFANDAEGNISIALVPFNGQINLGATLRQQYQVTDVHGTANANCLDLPAWAYSTTDLPTNRPIPMTAMADTFSSTEDYYAIYEAISSNQPNPANLWCPPSTTNIVRLPTRDATALKASINGLTAVGATSINAGMRWGLELLDPGSQPMFATLAAQGQIASRFAVRPLAYDHPDTLKVIVLMSDGENFAEERVNAGFRTGQSPIWLGADGHYSIFHPERVDNSSSLNLCASRPFWVPHVSSWHPRPWTLLGVLPSCYDPGIVTGASPTYGNTRQTWQQVWSAVRLKWVAYQLYARGFEMTSSSRRTEYFNRTLAMLRTLTPVEDMNRQLQDLCSMARRSNVTIFTIAFEAPAAGRTQLSNCASSPNHYFNAQGLQISDAFSAIAAQINRLRLVE